MLLHSDARNKQSTQYAFAAGRALRAKERRGEKKAFSPRSSSGVAVGARVRVNPTFNNKKKVFGVRRATTTSVPRSEHISPRLRWCSRSTRSRYRAATLAFGGRRALPRLRRCSTYASPCCMGTHWCMPTLGCRGSPFFTAISRTQPSYRTGHG